MQDETQSNTVKHNNAYCAMRRKRHPLVTCSFLGVTSMHKIHAINGHNVLVGEEQIRIVYTLKQMGSLYTGHHKEWWSLDGWSSSQHAQWRAAWVNVNRPHMLSTRPDVTHSPVSLWYFPTKKHIFFFYKKGAEKHLCLPFSTRLVGGAALGSLPLLALFDGLCTCTSAALPCLSFSHIGGDLLGCCARHRQAAQGPVVGALAVGELLALPVLRSEQMLVCG